MFRSFAICIWIGHGFMKISPSVKKRAEKCTFVKDTLSSRILNWIFFSFSIVTYPIYVQYLSSSRWRKKSLKKYKKVGFCWINLIFTPWMRLSNTIYLFIFTCMFQKTHIYSTFWMKKMPTIKMCNYVPAWCPARAGCPAPAGCLADPVTADPVTADPVRYCCDRKVVSFPCVLDCSSVPSRLGFCGLLNWTNWIAWRALAGIIATVAAPPACLVGHGFDSIVPSCHGPPNETLMPGYERANGWLRPTCTSAGTSTAPWRWPTAHPLARS